MWTETIKILELCVCNLFLEEIHSPSFMNCSLVLAPEGGLGITSGCDVVSVHSAVLEPH